MPTSFDRGSSPDFRGAEQGFSLFEMMIVLVLLGMLAAVVTPAFTRTDERRVRLAQSCVERELKAARLAALSQAAPKTWRPAESPCVLRFQEVGGRAVLTAGAGDPSESLTFQPDLRSTGGTLEIGLGGAQARIEIGQLAAVIKSRGELAERSR